MFIIYEKTFKKLSYGKCYIAEDLNENWIKLNDKEHARRFQSEEEARKFIKAKLKRDDFAIEELEK